MSKEKAIQAGVYQGATRVRAAAANAPAPAPQAETPVAQKPRRQALVAIEQRAPVSKPDPEEALAFATERNQSQVEPAKPALFRPTSYRRPEPSPFGSLVALEPAP